jgi:hypothetical protein
MLEVNKRTADQGWTRKKVEYTIGKITQSKRSRDEVQVVKHLPRVQSLVKPTSKQTLK